MEAIRFAATVGQSGIVAVPNVAESERIEVLVLKLGSAKGAVRKGGWAEGRIKILPGFDDPIPGMEDYTQASSKLYADDGFLA